MPLPPKPTHTQRFDPWNSLSSGHQLGGDNRVSGSTGWRMSRTAKLSAQFKGGYGGGVRMADSVGPGSSLAFSGRDGRKFNGEKSARQASSGCNKSIVEMMMTRVGGGGIRKAGLKSNKEKMDKKQQQQQPVETKRKIFDGLCFYVNGCTAPAVSDHRLKYMIVEHGGRVSIGLARRTVTHVVLGNEGAGGGLAAGKLQKEIQRLGGCVVKYVRVEWVLDSIKSGRRLPESNFSSVKLVESSQRSLNGMLTKAPDSSEKGEFSVERKEEEEW